MKSLAEALLIIFKVWDSSEWQLRTHVVGRPWEPPYKFDSNVSTMDKAQAQQVKALSDALNSPDSELGPNLKKKQKEKAATAQRQTDVYKLEKFLEAREFWSKWVKDNSDEWELVSTIDTWAQKAGVGCDDLINLSRSREVITIPYTSLVALTLLATA